MHLRHGRLDSSADVQIGGAGVLGMDAALHAHFRGTTLPRLHAPTGDFVEIEVIGSPPKILTELALGEGTKLTPEVADVGVIDIAIDDVRDLVAIDLVAQRIGSSQDRHEIVAPRGKELGNLRLVKSVAVIRFGTERLGPRGRVQRGRTPDAEQEILGQHRISTAGGPGALSCESRRIGALQDGWPEPLRDPDPEPPHVRGIDREPLGQYFSLVLRFTGTAARGVAKAPPD